MNEENLKEIKILILMSLDKDRVCLCLCLCVAHKDIKVRQVLCPPYAAVAHGSVPHDLLQGRLCYIKFPMEPLSSLDGLAGGHQQV